MSSLSPGEARQITPLPSATTSLLRSTLVIPSLPAALVELVQNALDAEATRIDVSVDLDRWTIKCEDNGIGITRSELSRIAGERYFSSKTLPGDESGMETFGFRGEALASLADMALLEMVSKNRGGSDGTVSLVVRGGERLYEGQASTERATEGTTVWIRDIFHKWPVRRRPLSTPSARITLLAAFRQALTTLSLLHPLVAFSLVDLSSSRSNAESGGAKRLINVVRSTEGILGRWRQLWGRAGTEKVWSFDRAEDIEKGIRAEGFFSLTAAHSKASQFIYVNSRPLANSPLHQLINDRFSQSSFARHAVSHLTINTMTSPSRQATSATGTKASRKSPKKSAERFPIFVLNLLAPPSMVDITLEPEKRIVEFEDPKRVHSFVQNIVDDFLRQEGFVSSNGPCLDVDDAISMPIDASQPQASGPQPPLVSTATDGSPTKRTRLTEISDNIAIRPAASVKRQIDTSKPVIAYPETVAVRPSAKVPEVEPPISWTDPATLQTFLIDPRTGNSWRPAVDCCSRAATGSHAALGGKNGERHAMVDRSALKRTSTDTGVLPAPEPSWMTQTIQSWTNPIFPSSKPGVRSITSQKLSRANTTPISTGQPLTPTRSSRSSITSGAASLSRSRISTLSAFFAAPAAAAGSSGAAVADLPTEVRGAGQHFSREDLKDAEFVAQVDKKFLLVKMRGRGDSNEDPDLSTPRRVETLVVVDQHAASERVRVEKLLEALCGTVARGEEVKLWTFGEEGGIGAPLIVVSRTEAILAAERLEDFARWGIGIEVPEVSPSSPTSDGDYIQLRLISVPLTVSDRLRVEARLQQELVRSYLAQLAERGSGRVGAEMEGERTWRSVVRHCPPVLLDLINSKACRGAIMFNDALTPTQCITLLAELSDTSFPFQCAHGRPSLMPVVNLAAPPPSSSSVGQSSSGWRAAPTAIAASRSIDWTRLRAGPEDTSL